jgi:leukotriene-A4 hydrolase
VSTPLVTAIFATSDLVFSKMNPAIKFGRALFALVLLACMLPSHAKSLLFPRGSRLDPSSYSNVDQFAPRHMSFELLVDFNRSSVIGNVTHTFTSRNGTATTVFLDVWDGLAVETSQFWTNSGGDCPTNWTDVSFNISTPNPNIGNALDVFLPCAVPQNATFFLRFSYRTTRASTALTWLTPAQTAGKTLPYMYSLCQMNYCRDFAPMMDSPSQKITYDATVVIPNEFAVRMSANKTAEEPVNGTHTKYSFNCTIKIPSYLIAIVVGDLKERFLSDRVSVIAESVDLEAAARKLVGLPEILEVVENYLQLPYIWGTYSIVIMPPSFPWGGMVSP